MIETVVGAALWALLVSCVLGAGLFALVALIIRLRTLDAAIRHALWSVAFWATALMPVVALGVGIAHSRPPHAEYGAMYSARDMRGERGGMSLRATSAAHERSIVRDALHQSPLNSWQPHLGRTAALWIAGVWFAGALIGLAGLLRGIVRIRGLKRRSSPLDAQLAAELPWLTEDGAREREIYLRLTYEIETPVAVGFRRPVILIPTELVQTGGLAAIEGLVMHEHAHLRRRDDWTNLAQRVIERLFWFNPLVWLAGRRIALEREIAADDAVVARTGEPQQYAQSLWQLAREMRMPEHTVVAPGALSTRKQISVRIEALLERRPVVARWRTTAAACVLLTAVGCTVAAAANAPSIPIELFPETAPAAIAATTVLRHATAPAHSAKHAPALTAPLRRHVDVAFGGVAGTMTPAASAPTAPPMPTVRPMLMASPFGARCASCDHTGANRSVGDGTDMSAADLRGVDWHGRTLRNVNLAGANLSGARLDDMRFIDCDLSGATLDGASLERTVIVTSDIGGTSFTHARTRGLQFVGMSLDGIDFRSLDIRSIVSACSGCSMQGADLRGADLHGLRISGISFSGANLRGANLARATLTAVGLEGAELRDADLRGATFTGCNFAGADLHGTLIAGTHFAPNNPFNADN